MEYVLQAPTRKGGENPELLETLLAFEDEAELLELLLASPEDEVED